MSDTGRVVADAQLRHEIAVYERARLAAGEGSVADVYAEQLSLLWGRTAGDKSTVGYGPSIRRPCCATEGAEVNQRKARARRRYVARYPDAWCGPRAEMSRGGGALRYAVYPPGSPKVPGYVRRLLGRVPSAHWTNYATTEDCAARYETEVAQLMTGLAESLRLRQHLPVDYPVYLWWDGRSVLVPPDGQ